MVDCPIYVIGFGLYGGITGPHEYGVTIQILHCGTGKVIAENETSFVCDGSSSTFRVLFVDPVEITPSVTYIASAFLKVNLTGIRRMKMFRGPIPTMEQKDYVGLCTSPLPAT